MWYQAWPKDWDGGDVSLVAYAESDDGIAWKGRRTRMRGAVNLIRRRTSHITVVVEEA